MDVIQIPTGVAVTLILAALGMMFGFGRVLLSQFNKSLDERFESSDAVQMQIRDSVKKESLRIDELTKQLQTLPLEYVRREDWIRFSAGIDAKLDRLADLTISAIQRGKTDA